MKLRGVAVAGVVVSLVLSGQVANAAEDDSLGSARVHRHGPRGALTQDAPTRAEREPAGTTGRNDTENTAEPLWRPSQLAVTGSLSADRDFYALDLRPGDVLSGSVSGGATRLSVHDPAHREVSATSSDISVSYPATTPLLGGGNAVVDFVAPTAGRYTIGVVEGQGAYTLKLKVLRPGTESAPRGSVPTLFVDFDGAQLTKDVFGTDVDPKLSPMSAFRSGWGLSAADESKVIDEILATLRENYSDAARGGTNPRFALRILNSRDNADPWGQPNVSRVVIGGTSDELTFSTVGVAQSIDPGNFAKEETAVVLLDRLSAPAGSAVSLNTYLTDKSDKLKFIGRALGNVASHEVGHMSGAWHTDATNAVSTMMDQSGNAKEMFQVGPDGVGGTADDVDFDFGVDTFAPSEGISGLEDTVTRMAWAFRPGSA